MSASTDQIAIVEQRASNGGVACRFHAINIYLALVQKDADGKPILPKQMTSAEDWARIRENELATRRVAMTRAVAEGVAQRVNAGKMSFQEAKEKFLATKKD